MQSLKESVSNSDVASETFRREGLDEAWLARIYREAGEAEQVCYNADGVKVDTRPDHRLRLEAANKVAAVHGSVFVAKQDKADVPIQFVQIVNEVQGKSYQELLKEASQYAGTNRISKTAATAATKEIE